MTLFPSILQFKNALLDYVNTSGESGYYLVRRFDEDVDGELDEKEFTNLAKYLGCNKFGGEDNVPIIFRELDAGGNGKISGSEIRSSLSTEIVDVVILTERVKKQFMNQMISPAQAYSEFNKNGDDGITFSEFRAAMQNRMNLNSIEIEELFLFST